MLSVKYFDHSGFYTIVLTEHVKEPYELIQNIFADLWSLHIINVNVLSFESIESGTSVFTFFPYSERYCDEVRPVLWDYFTDEQFTLNKEIFATKLDNFHGCPITLATYNVPPYVILTKFANGTTYANGIEGSLFTALSQKLNFRKTIIALNGTYLNSELYFNMVNSGLPSTKKMIRFVSVISAREQPSKFDHLRNNKYDGSFRGFHRGLSPLSRFGCALHAAPHSVHIDREIAVAIPADNMDHFNLFARISDQRHLHHSHLLQQ